MTYAGDDGLIRELLKRDKVFPPKPCKRGTISYEVRGNGFKVFCQKLSKGFDLASSGCAPPGRGNDGGEIVKAGASFHRRRSRKASHFCSCSARPTYFIYTKSRE